MASNTQGGRVLVAPQEFKESLSPEEAAAAITRGLEKSRPGWSIDQLPMSDGGPGFLEALTRATSSKRRQVQTHDALGNPRDAYVLDIRNSSTTAIEAAMSNGLALIPAAERRSLDASTEGVGELILAAVKTEPSQLIIGVGGSATSEGGSGMARTLGARFHDEIGRNLAPGAAGLAELVKINWTQPTFLEGLDVVIASDVTNPLVGPTGAAAIFGPQKGATPGDVARIEVGLQRYAKVVQQTLGIEIAELPGAGAAGGLAGGLVAFLNGNITSGFEVVAKATRLEERLNRADVVITGEGSFDAQSRHGKTTGRLQDLAKRVGKRCIVLAGRSAVVDVDIHTISELEPDSETSMRNAASLLEQLAARWAESVTL